MTHENIYHDYFKWLCEKITPSHCVFQHEELLSILNDIDFVIPIGMPNIVNDDHYTIMESRDLTNGVDFEESKYIESWEFGEQPLYETETIILYSDGVATDDLGDIVDDLNEKIGEDKLRDFIESEDEHLFIRNDILRMDYEIVKDDWKYSELSDK